MTKIIKILFILSWSANAQKCKLEDASHGHNVRSIIKCSNLTNDDYENEIQGIKANYTATIGVTITDSTALTEVNFRTFNNIVGSKEKHMFTFKKTSIKNIIYIVDSKFEKNEFRFVSNRIYFHIEDCKLENLDDIKNLLTYYHTHQNNTDSEKLTIFLKITNNPITEKLDKSYFEDFTKDIRKLNIGHTLNLKISENALEDMENLLKLELPGNNLESIPNIPSSVGVVDFSDNRIESINSKPFAEAGALKEINLGSNQIRTISSGTFDDNRNITNLVLVNNKIVSLNPEMFGFLTNNDSPEIVNVELYANPLDCSTCEMHLFQTFMKTSSENYGIRKFNFECYNPQEMHGYRSIDFAKESLSDCHQAAIMCGDTLKCRKFWPVLLTIVSSVLVTIGTIKFTRYLFRRYTLGRQMPTLVLDINDDGYIDN